MLSIIITIAIMYVGIGIMYMTDNNRKKYTDYQINRMLKQSAFAHM